MRLYFDSHRQFYVAAVSSTSAYQSETNQSLDGPSPRNMSNRQDDFVAPEDDPYILLGFDPTTTDVTALTSREISTSYRKQALRWHPDKNNGSAAASAMLARVFLAYETLSDPTLRAAHDDLILARRARAEEAQKLDAGRRRLREELEARERQSEAARRATRARGVPRDVEERLQREIERMRMDFGLAREGRGEGREDGVSARGGEKVGTEAGGRVEDEVEGQEGGGWEMVDGYVQWKNGDIPFDKLEAAVLARARGLIP